MRLFTILLCLLLVAPALARGASDDVFANGIVLCSRGLLLCHRDPAGFHVLLLDAATGQDLGKSPAIPCPPWEGFECSVQVDGQRLLGSWSCHEVFHWGNPPADPPPVHRVQGTFVVGLRNMALLAHHEQPPVDVGGNRPLGTVSPMPLPTPRKTLSAGNRLYRIDSTASADGTFVERTLICTESATGHTWIHPLRTDRRLWLIP
ncbi:MAG: hypothetical protein ACYCW6_08080 [Candidatus Xenobia bacterium]